MVAQREWTREWWDTRRFDYTIVTGVPVRIEIESGEFSTKKQVMDLIKDLPAYQVTASILPIIRTYIEHCLMPQGAMGDAAHLALASFYQCDFLLTWNCRHLANANKFRHVEVINRGLGLCVPTITTPLELLERSYE